MPALPLSGNELAGVMCVLSILFSPLVGGSDFSASTAYLSLAGLNGHLCVGDVLLRLQSEVNTYPSQVSYFFLLDCQPQSFLHKDPSH